MPEIVAVNEVPTTQCESWEHFCALLRELNGRPLDPIYRGQADPSWALVPPSAREHLKTYVEMTARGADIRLNAPARRGQVKAFERLATGLPGVSLSSLDEIDIEALARHHGLTTDLIDWTISPYVAAFFAFIDALDRANEGRVSSGTLEERAIIYPNGTICIWRLGLHEDLWEPGVFELLNSLAEINYWQKAQSGLFTRLAHEEFLDVVSYLAQRDQIGQLHRFVLPAEDARIALSDLQLMNINSSTLFPDLGGAARHANMGSFLL